MSKEQNEEIAAEKAAVLKENLDAVEARQLPALEFELAGYLRRGKTEAAELVKKEIAKLSPKKAKEAKKDDK